MSSTTPLRRTALPRQLARLGAVDRARLAVVPRLRSRAPRVPFVTLVSLLLLGGVVGLLLFNTSMQQASFTAASLEDQAAVLAAREQQLTTELDAMRNPDVLALKACELGLVVGPPAAFIDLGSGSISGTPTAAVPAPCGSTVTPPERPGAATAREARGNR